MKTIPSPEECGRKVLRIFANNSKHAGENMVNSAIVSEWSKLNHRFDDLWKGLDWCEEHKLLEQKEDEDNDAIYLTEKGFNEMQ